jgi:hypothetical protein
MSRITNSDTIFIFQGCLVGTPFDIISLEIIFIRAHPKQTASFFSIAEKPNLASTCTVQYLSFDL